MARINKCFGFGSFSHVGFGIPEVRGWRLQLSASARSHDRLKKKWSDIYIYIGLFFNGRKEIGFFFWGFEETLLIGTPFHSIYQSTNGKLQSLNDFSKKHDAPQRHEAICFRVLNRCMAWFSI